MKRIFSLLWCVLALASCSESTAKTEEEQEVASDNFDLSTELVLGDRGAIWGFEFLPDGGIIFTERSGKIGIFKDGKVTELAGVPKVAYESQGGLLDIALHPDFANNGWIYTAYLENVGKAARMNLIRFKIENNALANVEKLLSTSATNEWKGHNGSRILFDKHGYLFWSVGEGGKTSRGGKDSPNKNAQNVKELWGKVHRLHDDGKIPSDNPVLPGNTEPTSIYSYGHRNPQGLAYNAEADEVWESEHGPRGGDELNLIKKGENYGWPFVSYGINYDEVDISGKKHEGYTEPTFQWTPSLGACGLTYLTSDKYGSWKGSIFAGALALNHVSRIYFENGVAKEEKILQDVGRVRDVVQGPDGFLYLSLEGPGRIVKVVPSPKTK
ncbi:PQQ-dependent sugar dehydrogenase [Leadbetterella byssophila]|uniref:PQQ-dependent sugar dehydrogenase n=1 Tax=Leadbetterella byssophila TaxID=316068 RepID=UPI0039A209DF